MGNEVDLILETAQGLQPLEIKSGSTYAKDWVQGVRKWQALAGADSLEPALVYGGTESFAREGLKVWGWRDVAQSTRFNLVT